MFCIHCGKDVPAEVRFCPYCGTPVYDGVEKEVSPDAAETPAAPKTADAPVYTAPVYTAPAAPAPIPDLPADVGKPFHSGLATGIVFTVLSLLTANALALVTGILAIIFGGIASGRRKKGNMPSARSYAKAAKALNIATIILWVLWIVLIVGVFMVTYRLGMELYRNGTIDKLATMSPEEIERFLEQYSYNGGSESLYDILQNGTNAFLSI